MDLIGTATAAIGGGNVAFETLSPLQGATLNMGTPVNVATSAAQLGGYLGTFFGYARGLTLLNVNGSGGVISFFLAALVFVLLVIVATAAIPIIAAFIKWIIEIVRLIAEFIPF